MTKQFAAILRLPRRPKVVAGEFAFDPRDGLSMIVARRSVRLGKTGSFVPRRPQVINDRRRARVKTPADFECVPATAQVINDRRRSSPGIVTEVPSRPATAQVINDRRRIDVAMKVERLDSPRRPRLSMIVAGRL